MNEQVVHMAKHTVRIEENEKEVRIFVNPGTRDKERKPLAYITGSNCLILKK